MATLLKAADSAQIAAEALDRWIEASQRKSLLRFITCGSVDDGKSTLIGRLLYDSKLLFEDQLAALASDSKRQGTQGEGLDFSLLVDGLSAEREQGITIDVAYRFFATERRKFIVADTPGHEQYTRNMVTGASTADAAVILVDARKGVLTQTKRHSYLVHLLGIRQIVLAVNKIDLVDYDRQAFDRIVEDYRTFAAQAGIASFTPIPVSGLAGDNITEPSPNMRWYGGPPLIEHLEAIPAAARERADEPFRMAVQWVNRPDQNFRGYAGRIASGRIRVGDLIAVLPSGRSSTVQRIVTFDGDLDHAETGQSVTLTLADDIDCSRGDMMASPLAAPEPVTRFKATLVWMADEKLVPHRSYWLKLGTQTVSAQIDRVESIIDVNSLAEGTGAALGLNDIGIVEIDLGRAVPAIRYEQNRKLGGFVIIDKLSYATVAAGLIEDFPAAPKLSPHEATTSGAVRWIGGSNRHAWAAKAAARLRAQGQRVAVVDGQAVAAFSAPDPVNTAREVARLLAGAGVDVLITVEVPSDQAYPGSRVNSVAQDDGGDEWVI